MPSGRVRGGEAQGALPLDPTKTFLERKVLDSKELYKFDSIMCFLSSWEFLEPFFQEGF
jgi:hypothetical protein